MATRQNRRKTYAPVLRTAAWVAENMFPDGPSLDGVYKLAQRGVLPTVKVGHRLFFDETVLAEWAAAGGTFVDDVRAGAGPRGDAAS